MSETENDLRYVFGKKYRMLDIADRSFRITKLKLEEILELDEANKEASFRNDPRKIVTLLATFMEKRRVSGEPIDAAFLLANMDADELEQLGHILRSLEPNDPNAVTAVNNPTGG